MAKRHRDALAAQAGACNALALAHSLVAAIKEARDAGADWNCTTDAGARLIAHQLCFLLQVNALDSLDDYSAATRECEAQSAADEAQRAAG